MKKLITTAKYAVLALAAAVSISACGGGGSSSGPSTVSKGVVQDFGSVIVNGVAYKTVGATLRLPDDTTTPRRVLQNETEIRNYLDVGMVVTVKGRIDDNGTTGTASEIEFRDTLKGNLDNKGVDTITVMGQTILVDDSIKSILNQLSPNDDVQVSGITDDRGGLRATHIKAVAGLTEFESKGYVSGYTGPADNDFILRLSPTADTGITVIIGAGVARPAGLADGAFVEVKTQTASGGTITATRIEIEDELKAGENDNAELEGFISSISGDSFILNGQTVQTTATTLFVGGAQADLAVGMKVEAEGTISGTSLLAKKIVFKDNLRINANATIVDTAAKTIFIFGKTVSYSTATLFKDGGNDIADPATLQNRNIEVRGIMNATGNVIIATRVDLKNNAPATDAFIRGVVSAKSASSLTIGGITIDLTGAAFRGRDDLPITGMANFLSAVTVNTTVVKARWNPFTVTTAPVTEVEIDN